MSLQGTSTTKLYYWDGSDWVRWDGTVTATNLALKDGDSATLLDIESDGTKNAAFVQANDLDIRDLSSGSDSVSAVQSGTWNITNISGTVSLPTGASTSANQSTMITHLSEIEGAVETLEAADLMLGTDFSTVFGTSSLVLGTQADDVANTSDGIQTTSFGYVFDGTTWDRLRGDSTDGVLVNLGSNNDITLSTLPDTSSSDLASMAADLGTIDTDTGNIAAGFATEGSALGSGVLLQGDDGTDRKNINVDATTGDVQVDVTNTVTVDNGGTFAVQVDGSALTALQLIDDPVATISSTDVMRVAIFDDSDAQITSFGGGTQYAVDDALGSTPTGTLSLAIRDDALSSLTPVEGDAVGLRVDSTGGLWVANAALTELAAAINSSELDVNIATDSVGIGGGTEYTAGTDTYAEATSKVKLAGVVRNDTLASLVDTDNEMTALQVNSSGALYIQEGSALDVSAATVTVTGTVTANLGATDNAVLDQIELNTDDLLTTTDFNAAFGTAGSADSQVLSVQGIASMTPLLVDATGQGDVPVTLGGEDVTSATHDNFNANANMQVGNSDVSTSNPVPADHSITGIGHGVKTVTTAGTDVALAGSTTVKKVVIQAQTDNTGLIAVGASGVDATVATGTGVGLTAGDFLVMQIDNLSDVFIDATVDGEGVRYTYWT